MSAMDMHEKGIELIIANHGTTVTLIDVDGNEYLDVKCIFNAVQHGINLESVLGDPMGEKTNIYITAKELQEKNINIESTDWRVRGKKGKYEQEELFSAETPKKDSYLPGVLLFLTIVDLDAQQWENLDI